MSTSIEEEPTNRYWSGHDAALGLSAALRTLERIESEKSRWEWSMPFHVEQERDDAVAQAADAVRFLVSEGVTA